MAEKTNGQAVTAAKSLSKRELVRQAIGVLGRDAKPLQLRAHIKDKFGVEMSPNHISASKTEVLREVGGAKPATAPAAVEPAAPKPAATPKPAAKKPSARQAAAKPTATPNVVALAVVVAPEAGNDNRAAGISLQDIQAVKDLVKRLGAVQLRALIDLLA